MKVLVTGSAGLVGSACVEYFTGKGWEVVGVDNNGRSKMLGTTTKTLNEFDIRDEKSVNELFQKHTFDAVIHTAGQPSHDWAKDHVLEDFDTNARATVVLLEATRQYCPQAVFVYVSSDKVYGQRVGDKQELWNEEIGLDFAGQRSLFGCSKVAADLYVQEYGNYFGMKTACFRPGCITGRNHEGSPWHGMIAYIAHCVRTKTPYVMLGDNIRDQIHAHDLAAAFYYFIQNPKSGAVYNIGGGPERAISTSKAIKEFEKRAGYTIEVTYGAPRKGDRSWDVHDVSKFRKDYPEWDYEYYLPDILDDVWAK